MNDFISNFQETMSYVGVLMPSLLLGAWYTVKLFVVTLILSLPLGLPFALGGNSRFRILRGICKTYIWIFRGTPLLLQLFFFYFFLPITFGIKFSAFTTATLTFVLNYAAYFAEIYRGGINSIDKGQYEAAHSLGLSRTQTTFGIILPQTMKCVLPPVSNEAIVLIKDTALVSVMGVGELMKAATAAVNRDVSAVAYLIAAVIYLIFTFLLTLLSNYLERRFSVYDAKEEW
ncbi:amino acid ABC transporter permease [Anaerovorax odorimutans]|uniref:Amino acid ABC transporter permease n=1 Tax=Anaerovorax odorimutans TaxID=109327 RepID=A0ABT1RRH5_9FIRM|nr:amino acid ABC transporter permease [Anaerovorax odorimutans]MCQ4637803.1 amino acid ABC transporter permease [Anaerovorax odorimutans]